MHAWTEYKLSWELFQMSPAQLSGEQKHRLDQVVQKQSHIEQAILSSSEALGVIVPFVTLDARVAELRARYATAEAFQAELTALGLTENQLSDAVGRDLRVEAVLDRVVSAVPDATDVDVELYYRLNPSAFTRPETRRLRHILITFNDEAEKASALSTLNDLRQQVSDEEAFAQAALRHSQCPTAMDGGVLGTVQVGQLYPELDAYAFTMSVGQISTILESPMGLHLMRCDLINPEVHTPLDEVSERLKTALTEKRREKARRQWVKSLFNAANPVG